MEEFEFPKNFEELQEAIKEYTNGNYGAKDDDVFWFCAWHEAHTIFNTYRTKDLAQVLVEGYPALNTKERVNEYLETFFEPWEEDGKVVTECYGDIGELLKAHYG